MATSNTIDLTSGYAYDALPAPGYVQTTITADSKNFVLFNAPCNCAVYGLNLTVVAPANGTCNLCVSHISANNGANLTGNTVVTSAANVFYGSNVQGNVVSALIQNSSNGQLSLNVGDLLMANAFVNTGAVSIVVAYRSED